MPDDFRYDVFLSHSAKDKPTVREIAERLKKDGLKVWFDEWALKPGDSIPRKIDEGLECSRVLVLCMSANAFGSDWAQLEAGTFRFRDPVNKETRFIPVRLDASPIKGSLAQFLYIDWRHGKHAKEYPKLLEAVKRQNSSQTSVDAESKDQTRESVAHHVKARATEWNRMRSAFENEANKFPSLQMSLFFVAHDTEPSNEKFPQPNHVINLWQYYGTTDAKSTMDSIRSTELTRFGLSGAELTALAVLHGDQLTHFRSMAARAGTLLPDSISHLIASDIPERLGDLVGSGKPIMTSNRDPLAKWLNMLIVSTVALHPNRFNDGQLMVDPYAASLSIFDYFGELAGDSIPPVTEVSNKSSTTFRFVGIGRAWSGVRAVMQDAYSAKLIKNILGKGGLDMTSLGDTGTYKGEVLNRVDHLVQDLSDEERDELVFGCVMEVAAHETKLREEPSDGESEVLRNLKVALGRYGFDLDAI
ncbi:MAG: toll/interleukin-1 receptor domain-containing protein [Prosthecobacter sp.]|uniref:toll/interleukin-1 receptor domain-containing protein n=1 Tax=Prosthecobacter sp. TaxID=1965333 RepID=UPI002602E85D|nr:toll/interleukin-1 receptor domain-containing protein [Prosthecobacter sp.]MCF7789748.1 toll/interleukin-1 receptor domain-containing protein [Prosthecobacter sp.]